MAIVKHIRDNSGSGKEFESVTTSEIIYDTTPQVGSFNPVVSDGIAKALEVATEIPVVTSETAGKVLTASWDAETSTGSTSWGEAPAGAVVIDFNSSHTYTSEECAALASQAQAATTAKKPIFVCDVSGGSMYPPRYALLSFAHWGPGYVTEYVFVMPTTSATASASIDGAQNVNPNGAIYRLTRSSFTREGANVRSLPTTNSGTLGKVLGVTDSNGTLGWVTPQNLREGDAISIENGLVSVSHDGTLATEGGITSLAGDDGVSFDGAMHYYSFTLTSEEADALNAEISANGSVTVGLHFATSPVLSMRSDSQCYLHVYGGPSIDGVYGVSALIGRSDAMGVLTADLSHVTVGSFTGALSAGVFRVWISDSSVAPEPYGANKCDFTSNGHTPIAADISVGTYSSELSVANPVPGYTTSEDGKVLGVVDNAGTAELQWVSAGGGSADQPLPAVAINTLRFEFENMSFDPTNDTGCNFTGTSWAKVTEAVTRNIWDCTISNNPSSSSCFNIKEKCKVIDGRYSRSLSNLFSNWTVPSSSYDTSTGLISVDILLTGNAIYHQGASYAFSGCKKLKEVRFRSSEGGIYFSSAKCMFEMCYALESVTATRPVAGNTTSVGVFIESSTEGMFKFCYSLKSISGFSIDSDVTSLKAESMFDSCAVLSSVGSMFSAVGSSFSISKASQMFQGCTKLVEIGSALKISDTSIERMFNGCASLERVALLDLNNVVTTAGAAFLGCNSLAEVNIVNSGSVTNWAEAFSTKHGSGGNTYYSSNAPMLKLPSLDTSGATDVSNMFSGRKYADGALAMYNQLTQQANPPTSYNYCFYECGSITHASDLAQIPASWGGSGS